MFAFLGIVALLVANFYDVLGDGNGKLLSVIVLYRHGDRAPIRPYKNDPYDESFWPLGLGQLTNNGKKKHYGLGQWLRERYSDFLPPTYNKRNIQIHSSNVDRCLMSAELNVAGLYPPQGDQVWNEELRWQPIPIHTVPEKEDPILAQEKPCPKYNQLYDQLMLEEPFNSTLEKFQERMEYFSNMSGDPINSLPTLQDLYNTLYIEKLNGLELDDWTNAVFDEEVVDLCNEAWSSYAYTQDLARLRSGPLIDHILNHFEDVTNEVDDTPKFLMLSGHDSTIAPLLTSLEVFDNKWPDFASSVLFELRENEDGQFVNMFYKNPTEIVNLTLPECSFDCEFNNFRKILDPIRVPLVQWDRECLV